ncbi:diguanylate cyclase (GGDEF)-like protein [Mesorhizobium soli]|uniref:GGDEF domain-containing protein n=1 Tax=Pseudaminobacter soli (ex Li et al. 2025) TaxID=1295366 RepID=UPI002473408B|nr:GGDEF domain-containing protein [Mesorhizobium soli]MDH6231454.1 diguanylate cyclase (GGDEF)-like protein [Mesorhizobium soli]
MSGAVAVLVINLVVAGLLSASFAMVAIYDRKQVAASWLSFAYGLGAVYYSIEFGISTIGAARPAVVVSFSVVLAAMLLFNVGAARKFEVPVPWRLLGAVFFISAVACDLIQDMPRASFTRMMIYQAPYFVMQAIGAWILWSARSRRRLDTILMWLLAVSSLQFLSKPFLLSSLGGTGATPQHYLQTQYALISQSMGTVFAIAIALLFLVILARDVIADVTKLSNTDALSGLLNRGGFERHATAVLQAELRKGRSLALVICDLDHFKAINDTFGHASGDNVIKAFASFLRTIAVGEYFAGRIGGEEFAIILPGSNLVTARLFAETARSAFSGLPVDGLPDDLRFTASFGVAELVSGEDLSELLSRADKALYEAKENGRDCVRTALPTFDGMRAFRSF